MSFNAYGAKITMRKAFDKFVARGVALAIFATVGTFGLSHTAMAEEPTTILALGDSLTAGYGLNQGDGFVPQLEGWLRENGQDVSLINAGVSGDTTAGGHARLGWSLNDEVDLVLVNLGGNDMLRGLPASETRKNLDAILSEVSNRNLPAVVIRVPGSLNFGVVEKEAYDQAFTDLAQQYDAAYVPNFFYALEQLGETDEDRRKPCVNICRRMVCIRPKVA